MLRYDHELRRYDEHISQYVEKLLKRRKQACSTGTRSYHATIDLAGQNDRGRGPFHAFQLANLVEQELTARLTTDSTLLPDPSKGRLSRLSRTFPVTPRVDLRADERGQFYILSVSANDRPGLLYSIARVLAEHRVGVASARINTLGERVEDVFLLDGHGLSDNRLQIQVETELLRAIAV